MNVRTFQRMKENINDCVKNVYSLGKLIYFVLIVENCVVWMKKFKKLDCIDYS